MSNRSDDWAAALFLYAGQPLKKDCEDCTDGWIHHERPVSLGHGPSEHFTYETWREPCESCEKGRQNDEQ
tara:strand:- start:2455 stop:2664 length:210 start_codon:yes stop_codon:yes gene_type:complete